VNHVETTTVSKFDSRLGVYRAFMLTPTLWKHIIRHLFPFILCTRYIRPYNKGPYGFAQTRDVTRIHYSILHYEDGLLLLTDVKHRILCPEKD